MRESVCTHRQLGITIVSRYYCIHLAILLVTLHERIYIQFSRNYIGLTNCRLFEVMFTIDA